MQNQWYLGRTMVNVTHVSTIHAAHYNTVTYTQDIENKIMYVCDIAILVLLKVIP